MNMHRFILLGFVFFFSFKKLLFAQQNRVTDSRLTLVAGDKLPESLWFVPFSVINHPSGKRKICLNDYRDKLIILDFWATTCLPCIRAMPKLDSLQKSFGESVCVLPVTYEDAGKVLPILTKHGRNLPSIIGDTLLGMYFPHYGVPHQVWIRNGIFFGESASSAYANSINISRALKGENFILSHSTAPVSFDYNLPLFYNGNGGTLQHPRMRSVFSKRINVDVGGGMVRNNSIMLYNAHFITLIYEMHREFIPFPGRTNRIVWEINDSLKNEFLGTYKREVGIYEKDIDFQNWQNEYMYCYELSVDSSLKMSKKELRKFMSDDLNRYFRIEKGIETIVDKRKVQCYEIKVLDQSQGGYRGSAELSNMGNQDYFVIKDQSVRRLTSYVMSVLSKQSYPVVDRITSEFNVSIRFEKNSLNASSIKKELNKIGLDLSLTVQEMDVIVVKYANTLIP